MKAKKKSRPLIYPFDTITKRKPLMITEPNKDKRTSISVAARQYGKRHGIVLSTSSTNIGVTIQLAK